MWVLCMSDAYIFHLCPGLFFFIYIYVYIYGFSCVRLFELCLSMHLRETKNGILAIQKEGKEWDRTFCCFLFIFFENVHSYIFFNLFLLRLFFFSISIFFFSIFNVLLFIQPSIQPCKHNDFSDEFWRTHVIALMLYCVHYMKYTKISIVLFLSYILSHSEWKFYVLWTVLLC